MICFEVGLSGVHQSKSDDPLTDYDAGILGDFVFWIREGTKVKANVLLINWKAEKVRAGLNHATEGHRRDCCDYAATAKR